MKGQFKGFVTPELIAAILFIALLITVGIVYPSCRDCLEKGQNVSEVQRDCLRELSGRDADISNLKNDLRACMVEKGILQDTIDNFEEDNTGLLEELENCKGNLSDCISKLEDCNNTIDYIKETKSFVNYVGQVSIISLILFPFLSISLFSIIGIELHENAGLGEKFCMAISVIVLDFLISFLIRLILSGFGI